MTVTNPDRRRAIRELVDEVRHILLKDWDPLYVGGNPALADEYDFALGEVMAGLACKPSSEDIVALLAKLEKEDLGLPTPRPDLCMDAANNLLLLRARSEPWPNSASHEDE